MVLKNDTVDDVCVCEYTHGCHGKHHASSQPARQGGESWAFARFAAAALCCALGSCGWPALPALFPRGWEKKPNKQKGHQQASHQEPWEKSIHGCLCLCLLPPMADRKTCQTRVQVAPKVHLHSDSQSMMGKTSSKESEQGRCKERRKELQKSMPPAILALVFDQHITPAEPDSLSTHACHPLSGLPLFTVAPLIRRLIRPMAAFSPDLLHEIFKLVWKQTARRHREGEETEPDPAKKNRSTTANTKALKLSCELLRIFVVEAVQRAALVADTEGATVLQGTHFERILPQLLLDF